MDIFMSYSCHIHVIFMDIFMSYSCHILGHIHVIFMSYSWTYSCHIHVIFLDIFMSYSWTYSCHIQDIFTSYPFHFHVMMMMGDLPNGRLFATRLDYCATHNLPE